MALADDVELALKRVVGAMPAGEDRPQQQEMARAVAVAIERKRHLLVQASTGVGKSVGYLIPAILAARSLGSKSVVATATTHLDTISVWPRRRRCRISA